MASAALILRKASRQILDLALPPRCPGCGAVTADARSFCLDCWQALTFLGDPCCRRCGLPFAFDGAAEAECAGCIADPPEYDSMRAAVAYGELARKVVLRLKYGGRPGTACTIAHFMQRHMPVGADVLLTPVPLHRWRIWRRGYNQSALIARWLARRRGDEVALDLLRRVKATPPLKGMSRRERAQTVRGAFRISPGAAEKVKGRKVVLVDDVYTTGATVNACARLLKRAGAAEVIILCWARVVAIEDD